MEELVHNSGVLRGHHLLAGVVPVVQNYVAVMIFHIIIRHGLAVYAAVCEHAESGRHVPHGDAIGLAADSASHAVAVFLHQGGEVQLVHQPFIARLGGDVIGKPGCRGVLGHGNGPVHAHIFLVGFAEVLGPAPVPAAELRDGLILQHAAIGDGPAFNAHGIGPHCLDGRAGLPGALGGVIEQEQAVSGLPGADNRHHLAGVGIHHKEAKLYGRVVREHVCVCQEQVLHVLLQLQVHGAVDFQARVIHHAHSVFPAVAVFLHQVCHHIFKHDVNIPVPFHLILAGLVFFAGVCLLAPVKGHGFQFGYSLVILGLGNFHQAGIGNFPLLRKLQHTVQHVNAALFGVLREYLGIILPGILGDARYQGALRQGAVPDGFAEIGQGGGLHALVGPAIVYQVQVGLQDFFLGIQVVLHVEGCEDFLHLPQDAHLLFACDVFNKLLGQGGAAAARAAAHAHQARHSAQGAPPVHALVLVEAVILNAYLGGLHNGGDIL